MFVVWTADPAVVEPHARRVSSLPTQSLEILCSILTRQVWRRNETIVFGFPAGPDCCGVSDHLFSKV